MTQHIGPSQFSHNFKSEDMLETEAHHDALNFSEERCDIEEKRRFIQTFYTVVSGSRSDDWAAHSLTLLRPAAFSALDATQIRCCPTHQSQRQTGKRRGRLSQIS